MARRGYRRKKRRWVWPLICGLLLLLILGFVVPYRLMRSVPTYWDPLDATDEVVQAEGLNIENFLVTQASMVRDETWSVRLTDEQVNAWLAARLPSWLVNQGVDADVIRKVPAAMAHFDESRAQLAAEVQLGDVRQIVSFAIAVQQGDIESDTPAVVRLAGVKVGRMPVPFDPLFDRAVARLDEDDQPEAHRVRQMLDGTPLRMKLSDKRVVTVLAVRLEEGAVVLMCRTRLP